MRVISQKGIEPMVDLPYEQTTLVVRENFIFAIIDSRADMLIARYSTKEKANKEMEKLHETYMGAFMAKEIDISPDFEESLKAILSKGFCITTVQKGSESATFEPANMVFRFPQDSIRRREMKNCGNCKYHVHKGIDDGRMCMNADSEHCADWTDDDYSCEEWEGKDERQEIYP